MDDVEVLLPGGLWDAQGHLHRTARLRPLTGREEELLASDPRRLPAQSVTDLLSRCLLRLGSLPAVTANDVERLLVADRELLLLRLRQLTFGDLVWADLVCPWRECGERVTISFALSEVPVHEPPARLPEYALRLPDDAAEPREVTFRLPNGSDQAALSAVAATNEAQALTGLLQRCLVTVDGVRPTAETVAGLKPHERAAIEAEMERVAPWVERTIETKCAECGRTFIAPFDLHACFFGELRADRDLLYREVHHLAFNYHWSEPDIMTMTRQKRHAYLEILAEEIERMNSG